MSRKNKLRLAASCAVALAMSQSARATSYSWTNAVNGNWTDASNWTPNTGVPVAGDSQTFNASGVNGAETIYLNGGESAATATFDNTGTTIIVGGTSGAESSTQTVTFTGGITMDSGAGPVTFGTSATNTGVSIVGTPTFTANSTNQLTIGTAVGSTAIRGGAAGTNLLTLDGTGNGFVNGIILNSAGTTAVTKNGTGFWELAGNSSFTGPVILNAGTLSIKSVGGLGGGTKTFTMNGGTFANDGARNLAATIGVAINGDVGFGTGTTGGSAPTFSGVVTLSAGNHNITANNSVGFLGQVTGPGGFTKVDSTIPGNNPTNISLTSTTNNYSGATTILAGSLVCGVSSGGSNTTSPNSAMILGPNGTLQANFAGSLTIASLSDYQGAGGNIIMGNVNADNLTTGGDNTDTTFSGTFSGMDSQSSGGVTKVGTGTWELTGASAFNGYLKVNNGTVAFTTIGDLGAPTTSLFSPITVANGTIALGSTTDGALKFVGTAPASSNRVINLAGTTGGGVLDASGGSGDPITFTSNLTATGVGIKTLTLTGSNTDANTLQGAIPDSSGGATSLAKSGAGTWVLTGASTYTGGTSVSNGKLTLNTNLLTSTSLSVTGGTLELGAAQTRVIQTPTVSVTGTGKLDVQNNKMIVSTTPIGGATGGVYDSGSVQGMVQSGRNGGGWNGVGIVTSQATAMGGTALTTLGVDVASDVTGVSSGTTLWAGQTVNPTDTLVKYTYAGDANLSGSITGDDYFKIDQGFANHLTGYANGDFNYDGVVNADDYFIIDKNYVQQTTAFPSAAPLNLGGGLSAVPEPASLGLLGLSAAGLFGRRKRNR